MTLPRGPDAPIRLLTFTTLFPHAARPNHGIFVENRLRHLLHSGQASSIVLAPVPWFPNRNRRWGEWALHAQAPLFETRHGIPVHHPRFPVIPKLGMSAAPWLVYRAMVPVVSRLLRDGHRFDAIDAHYVYPDGVAAAWLGRRFDLPVVVTARGIDVSLIPRYTLPRRLILGAIRQAGALIAVSAALKAALVALGAPDDKVTVLRNGVETNLFRPPTNRDDIRAALGLTGPTLVSVGSLIPRKGHDRTIQAMAHLPEFTLLIVGEGPEDPRQLVPHLELHGIAPLRPVHRDDADAVLDADLDVAHVACLVSSTSQIIVGAALTAARAGTRPAPTVASGGINTSAEARARARRCRRG